MAVWTHDRWVSTMHHVMPPRLEAAVLAPFAVLDMNDQPAAVDIPDPEMGQLGDTQPGRTA